MDPHPPMMTAALPIEVESALAATSNARRDAQLRAMALVFETVGKLAAQAGVTGEVVLVAERDPATTTVTRVVLVGLDDERTARARVVPCGPGALGDTLISAVVEHCGSFAEATQVVVWPERRLVAVGGKHNAAGMTFPAGRAGYNDDENAVEALHDATAACRVVGVDFAWADPDGWGLSAREWERWCEICGFDSENPMLRLEAGVIARNGWTPNLMEPWWADGFSPMHAASWAHEGISRTDALAWRDAGFDPRHAAQWRQAGATVEIATMWVGSHSIEAAEAASKEEWTAVGIRPGRASGGWRQLGIGPEEASRWIARGAATPKAVRKMIAGGVTDP